MTAVSRIYRTADLAQEIAEILESFGLEPRLATIITDIDGGQVTGWEVSIASPRQQSGSPIVARYTPDPFDLDETADYIDSHWDREADDRDIYDRRGRHVE